MFHPDGPTFLELMRQALSSTEHGYDLLAPKFDHTPFRTPDAVLGPMVSLVGEVDDALDVCCGTGAAMRALRPVCRRSVVGLDFSQGMLDEAARRLEGAPGDARVELVRGDALSLPFEDAFDLVTSVGAFGHILPEDEDRFVAGIARALRRGGRFVFATAEKPPFGSRAHLMSRGFNAVMRVRNAVLSPPFIMYYLTFLWPDVKPLLERHGLEVTAHRGACPAPFERAILVEAKKR